MTIAPDTPNNATAQGPMQHKPMNEAIALMLMAPPEVAMSFLSSFIVRFQSVQQEALCWMGGHLTVPYEQKTQQSAGLGRNNAPQP